MTEYFQSHEQAEMFASTVIGASVLRAPVEGWMVVWQSRSDRAVAELFDDLCDARAPRANAA